MMKVYYMNGAGNDFMVIDARGLTLDFSNLAFDINYYRNKYMKDMRYMTFPR